MSKLLGLIDAYRDTHGQPSDASIARAVGIAPQTLSSWRSRGIRALPETETMRSLAGFLGLPYRTVLEAALVDANYMSERDMTPAPAPSTTEEKGRRTG